MDLSVIDAALDNLYTMLFLKKIEELTCFYKSHFKMTIVLSHD